MNIPEYIVTDEVAMAMLEQALADMGLAPGISAILLDGPPGCGKTFLGKHAAWRLGAELMHFTCMRGAGREELLLDTLPGRTGERELGILPKAMRLSQERKVVLLLDELDKAEESVDAFLLALLQEGHLLVPQVGLFKARSDQLLVVITKNDHRDVTGPLARRCRMVMMRWPSPEVETRILQQQIPKLTVAACEALIGPAWMLREHPEVRRPPSTPELIRVARDLLRLAAAGATSLTLGEYYVRAIAPRPADQSRIDKPSYLGLKLRPLLGACPDKTGEKS
ncbi:MAG: MoxR family ATPase [Verrucomicrobiae bacterium]|nr:MoxR family ATPase [Verrucomicrobiae bacterium]